MNVTVVAVGKLKERFWAEACAEYLKRLGPYARVSVAAVADVDPARAGGEGAARAAEGRSVLSRLPERAHVIALAIDGKARTSEELSARLDALALDGASDVAFVIGGSTGIDAAPPPGARGAARAALPGLQDLPRRALPQVGRREPPARTPPGRPT